MDNINQILYSVYTPLIIIILIILCYFFATYNNSNYEKYLYGFYCADGDEFCETTDIDSMMIFIGEPCSSGTLFSGNTERTCYMVIMNDICNQGFTMKYSQGYAGAGIGKYCITADLDYDIDCIWPDRVTLEFNMLDGTLKIHDGETIYAKLYKQNDVTQLCELNP